MELFYTQTCSDELIERKIELMLLCFPHANAVVLRRSPGFAGHSLGFAPEKRVHKVQTLQLSLLFKMFTSFFGCSV